MESPGFELLYEKGPCLVVAKPGGVLTQAPPGIDSLEVRVKRFLDARDAKTGRAYLSVAHRLDRPVSGAVIFSRKALAAKRMAKQFEARTIHKKYWAVVAGRVAPMAGAWSDYLRKIPDVAKAELVAPEHPEARLARLRYRVLAAIGGASLLEIELETGRMHQIRLQAAAREHPVWGDELYGTDRLFGPPSEDPRARWIALHAIRLEFQHPMTREVVCQVAPLPEAWHDELPAELVK